MTSRLRFHIHGIYSGYLFLIAIIPVVFPYKAPGVGVSLSSVILIVTGLFALIDACRRIKIGEKSAVLPWAIYYLWVILKCGTLNRIISLLLIIQFFELNRRGDAFRSFRKTVECISLLAFFAILLQYIGKYIFGVHIPMIIRGLCTDSIREQYSTLIMTGYPKTSAIYRPSAFFLEPANYTEFCIFGLLSTLCNEKGKRNFIKSALITIGILMSTSGMGIVLSFGLWMWKYVLGNRNLSAVKRAKQIIAIILGLLIVLAILIQIQLFQNAVARIFGTSSSLGALQGRTLGMRLFLGKSVIQLLWGEGEAALPQTLYLTGLVKVIYAYGLIGLVLLLYACLRLFLISNQFGKVACVLYFGFLLVADQVGFIGSIFMIGIAFCSRKESQEHLLPDRLPAVLSAHQ